MDLRNIFLIIWNMSLTGSIIILCVLLVRFFLRKAPKIFSYILWSAVLFRLLCPVSISSAFSVLHFTKAAEPVSQNVITTMDYSTTEIPELIPSIREETNEELPIMDDVPVQSPQTDLPHIPEMEEQFLEMPLPELPQEEIPEKREPVDYAVLIWLLGLGVMLIYNVISCIRLLRQIEGAVPLRKELYLADYIPTAFVLGVIRPRIYLPSYLTPEEQGYIIAHERCHIKRKDHISRLLAYLALCLHWFNPLVWIAFIFSGKDMEMSCDEAVIRMYGPRIRADYSASLLRLATGHRSFALTPLAFGEGDTKERVINMSKWQKPKVLATVAALLVSIIVLVACAVNPADKADGTAPTYFDREKGAVEICIDAMDALLEAESYYIRYEREYANDSGTIEYRRHGENQLIYDTTDPANSRVYLDSKLGYFHYTAQEDLSYWVWQSDMPDYDPDAWLKEWSPEYLEIGNTHMGENSITHDVRWPHPYNQDRYYKGSITYTFRQDGTLDNASREGVLMEGDKLIRGYTDRITVMESDPEGVLSSIQHVAVQCISPEEWTERSATPLPEIPLPERRSIGVNTVDELIAAIGPDTAISLEAGFYDLSKATTYGQTTGNRYCYWNKVYDGYELTIRNVDNFSISGAGIHSTTIEAAPRYADVFKMENCSNLWFHGFTAGHTRNRSECAGDVIELSKCTDAELYELGLFGCGVVGLTTRECNNIILRDSDIYDCSSSAVQLERSNFITMSNCNIYEIGANTNGSFAVFYVSDCAEVQITGCKITDNISNYLITSSYSSLTMRDCLIADNRFEDAALQVPGISTIFIQNQFRDNSIRNWFHMSSGAVIDENGNRLTEDMLNEMYGTSSKKPVQPQLKVRVSTVDELIAAIGPNREIILEGAEFDLSTATGYGTTSGDYYHWEEFGDGPQLIIQYVDNMTIKGKDGKDGHRIVAVPRFVNVLSFRGCSNITLTGFTAGHSEGDVGCTGGVLFFRDCDDFLVDGCGLFGCGTMGVDVEDSAGITVTNSEIYECSEGGIRIRDSKNIRMKNNTFRDISGREYILLISCIDAVMDDTVLIDSGSYGTVHLADPRQQDRNALEETLSYFQSYYWGNQPEELSAYLSESYNGEVVTYGQGDGSFLSLHYEITFDHVQQIEEHGSTTMEIRYRPYKYDDGEKFNIIRYLHITVVKENGSYKISNYQLTE